MLSTTLNFKRGKKKYAFDLVHNLDELGLSIDAALINWSTRTDNFTEEDFVEYVKSKDPLIICVTKKRFEELKSQEI